MVKRTRRRQTEAQKNASARNFEIFILTGMIANLHNIRYAHRTDDEEMKKLLGLALDILADLRSAIREYRS